MTAIEISPRGIRGAKLVMSGLVPQAKSSHLTEAIARGLGFRTHAALKAAQKDDPDILLFEPVEFLERLRELSSLAELPGIALIDGWLEAESGNGVFPTAPLDDRNAGCSSRQGVRFNIWRKAMSAGINEAINQRLISVRPGDNRWEDIDDHLSGAGLDFEVCGQPAFVHVSDASFDEVSVKVYVWPTDNLSDLAGAGIINSTQAFRVCDLYASGWLERRNGAWLQTGQKPIFFCRQSRLQDAKRWPEVARKGYGLGPLIM